MLKLESVLEIKIIGILRDFQIQMDHLISAWRPDIVLINKKKSWGRWDS